MIAPYLPHFSSPISRLVVLPFDQKPYQCHAIKSSPAEFYKSLALKRQARIIMETEVSAL